MRQWIIFIYDSHYKKDWIKETQSAKNSLLLVYTFSLTKQHYSKGPTRSCDVSQWYITTHHKYTCISLSPQARFLSSAVIGQSYMTVLSPWQGNQMRLTFAWRCALQLNFIHIYSQWCWSYRSSCVIKANHVLSACKFVFMALQKMFHYKLLQTSTDMIIGY